MTCPQPGHCSPETLSCLPADAVIIDVRTGAEHAAQKLSCAHLHIPLDRLDAAQLAQVHRIAAGTPLYLLCHAGARAAKAAAQLAAGGYSNVHVISGGILACHASGIATTTASCGAPALSLERQVRVAAGVLVATGAALALTLDPRFALLSLAVGCGLVFAGLTNRCGLALCLAHAPWNRPRT